MQISINIPQKNSIKIEQIINKTVVTACGSHTHRACEIIIGIVHRVKLSHKSDVLPL